jgi:hypothetical protein
MCRQTKGTQFDSGPPPFTSSCNALTSWRSCPATLLSRLTAETRSLTTCSPAAPRPRPPASTRPSSRSTQSYRALSVEASRRRQRHLSQPPRPLRSGNPKPLVLRILGFPLSRFSPSLPPTPIAATTRTGAVLPRSPARDTAATAERAATGELVIVDLRSNAVGDGLPATRRFDPRFDLVVVMAGPDTPADAADDRASADCQADPGCDDHSSDHSGVLTECRITT